MTKSTGVGRGNNPRSHGNSTKGPQHHRWSDNKIVSSHGYVKLRVGTEHPLADHNGYAYEHLLVWVSAGRPKPEKGQTLHHINENKGDNRLSNLELLTRIAHSVQHHASLSDDHVRGLRERYAAGEDGTKLAAEFGIPFQRVYKLLRGETRRDAGGPMQTGSLRGKKAAGRLLDGVPHDGFPPAEGAAAALTQPEGGA